MRRVLSVSLLALAVVAAPLGAATGSSLVRSGKGTSEKPRARATTITSFAIVVNAACPAESLSSTQASALFLKTTGTWPDGRPATPVDLPADSPVRNGFSLAVHGHLTPDVVRYWKEEGASIGAPAIAANDAEVLALVRDNPLAIGYVSGDTAPIDGTKVLPLVD